MNIAFWSMILLTVAFCALVGALAWVSKDELMGLLKTDKRAAKTGLSFLFSGGFVAGFGLAIALLLMGFAGNNAGMFIEKIGILAVGVVFGLTILIGCVYFMTRLKPMLSKNMMETAK